MKLSDRIWEELGTLSTVVECVDHDNGTVRFKDGVSQSDKDAVAASISAHNPLSKSAETLRKETEEAERADAKSVAALLYLANHTNAEIRAFIDSNINVASVTDLASAKACLNRMENRIEDLAVGLAVFVRRELR